MALVTHKINESGSLARPPESVVSFRRVDPLGIPTEHPGEREPEYAEALSGLQRT